MNDALVLELAVERAADNFDSAQDCSCATSDETGTCWYNLSETQQRDRRVAAVAERLGVDPLKVAEVLGTARGWITKRSPD